MKRRVASSRHWVAIVLSMTAPSLADPAEPARAPAPAVRSRVILVRPAPGNTELAEAPTRIRAELEAAGFAVEIVDGDPALEPREQLIAIDRQNSAGPAPIATIVLAHAAAGMAADIWIADRLTAKTTVRRIDIPATAQAPSILAVRTVELLRASLLESQQPSEPPAEPTPEPAPPPAAPVAHPDEPATTHTAFDLGASGLFGFEEVGPLIGPLVRGSFGSQALAIRGAIAAPIFGPSLSETQGSASVKPLSLELALVPSLVRSASLQVYGSLAVGAYLARVQGQATPPAVAHSSTRAGGAFSLGLGAEIAIARQAALFVEPQVSWWWPALAIDIAGAQAGSIGHPALSLCGGVTWTL